MRLEDVRELKLRLLESLRETGTPIGARSVVASSVKMAHSFAALRERPQAASHALSSIALGAVSKSKTRSKLAIRVQRKSPHVLAVVEQICLWAKNEVDVRYVGRISSQAKIGAAVDVTKPAFYRKRRRPLHIGSSISDVSAGFDSAGTLGCFVRGRTGGAVRILSNNHVIAGENATRVGSPIVQPGTLDAGNTPTDDVAVLAKFVRLKKSRPNLIDAATATLLPGIDFDSRNIGRLGQLAGQGDVMNLFEGAAVFKVGRTTGQTEGRLTASEIDNVSVEYDLGWLRFDNQIEIEGTGSRSFSDSGDSGSLIVDESLNAIGLLFAGGDSGGTNNRGLTYANPIQTVLDSLAVEFL